MASTIIFLILFPKGCFVRTYGPSKQFEARNPFLKNNSFHELLLRPGAVAPRSPLQVEDLIFCRINLIKLIRT
jgi:hypothetical protein